MYILKTTLNCKKTRFNCTSIRHAFSKSQLNFKRYAFKARIKQEHSDIGPSAYFAKLDKKKVNEEKEIEKHMK